MTVSETKSGQAVTLHFKDGAVDAVVGMRPKRARVSADVPPTAQETLF
jgi:hypothetical protein